MPLGNGDLVSLVWVNASTGALQFYTSKADAFASDTLPLKLGMVSLAVTPNPFTGAAFFNQSLDMATSTLTVAAGASADSATTFTLWIDANTNAMSASIRSASGPVSVTATVVSVRPDTLETYQMPFNCNRSRSVPDVLVATLPPSVDPASVMIYKRNDPMAEGDYVGDLLVQQGLASLVPAIPNVFAHRQFGFLLSGGPAFRRTDAAHLQSVAPSTSFSLTLTALTNVTASSDEWVAQLAQQAAARAPNRTAHEAWWSSFWGRSHIVVGQPTGNTSQLHLSSMYAITRYVQSIQSRTAWPIRFNGQLFVANTPDIGLADNGGPNYREWGGSDWWQNSRLPYGSMLASGDSDIFESMLQWHLSMLPFARARTQEYFGFDGMFFTETKTLFGAYSSSDYGCSRPGGFPVWLEESLYVGKDFMGNGGGGELPLFVLDHYLWTGDEAALQKYLPLATLSMDFVMNFYQNRSGTGEVAYWPSQALETFWCDWPNAGTCCVNDMPTVSGVISVLRKLLALPASFTTQAQRDAWAAFLAIQPPLPTSADGSTLLPAEVISSGTHNSETPELFAVHPHRVLTLGTQRALNATLTPAINSYNTNPLAKHNEGWPYGILTAALLGQTDDAAAMVLQRSTLAPAPGYRFPGFAPHEQDYEPSADHFANMNTALQLMLLQPVDDGFEAGTTLLMPAWPCDWDVSFKLHAPLATVVEVEYASGKLLRYVVTPQARQGAMVWVNCANGTVAA